MKKRLLALLLALLCCLGPAAGALRADAQTDLPAAENDTDPPEDPDGPDVPEEPACAATGEHVPGAWTFAENGKHTSACTLCGQPLEEACAYATPAVYVALNDGTHARECTVCGGREITPCAFADGRRTQPTETEPGTLERVCTVCGQRTVTETAAAENQRAASARMGDVNGDGAVASDDARSVLRAAVKLEAIPAQRLPLADMDEDGAVTAGDARLALRAAVGLEPVRRHDVTVTVDKKPTCTQGGKLRWSCAYCGEARQMDMPANGHKWIPATAKAARRCSVCGTKVTGWDYVGPQLYYYKADGTVPAGKTLVNAKLGGVTAYWYLEDGALKRDFRGTLTYGGADWIIISGRGSKVTTAADRTLFLAFGEVAKATKPGMTMEQKLRACFVYCKHYPERQPRYPHYTGVDWPIIYANDMFSGKGGNCCSFGAAFAYMAKAIGYENVYCCNSGGHGWAEVNGLVYDPEWSKRDGLNAVTYYALSYDAKCDVAYKRAISARLAWMHVKI